MKKVCFIASLISILFIITSCGQKLPLPKSNMSGILIIPTSIKNNTPYSFGYYYNYIYIPEKDVVIKIVPMSGKKFTIIDNFPNGDYEINGIKYISSISEGTADVGSATNMFDGSIPFKIKSNEITILKYKLLVEQKFEDSSNVERYHQPTDIKPLQQSEYNQIVRDLQSLPNAELWNLAQLGVMPESGQDRGVIQDYYNNYLMDYAKQGYADAQYNLGLIYENGEGVSQSDKKAAQWFKKAAEQGYPAAKIKLAELCEKIPEACK